jgi:site-specific DNA-methyltransferase (adenine-specific)
MYDISSHTHKFLKEDTHLRISKEMKAGVKNLYGNMKGGTISNINGTNYDPPLPNSVIRDTKDYKNNSDTYGKVPRPDFMRKNGESRYDPPLPNSVLEIKSQKGKHATQKPTGLIEWCLKYYSKEGDIILDPTMGSGSTGVACKNMNRKFIGIEKDEKIFNDAIERLK